MSEPTSEEVLEEVYVSLQRITHKLEGVRDRTRHSGRHAAAANAAMAMRAALAILDPVYADLVREATGCQERESDE